RSIAARWAGQDACQPGAAPSWKERDFRTRTGGIRGPTRLAELARAIVRPSPIRGSRPRAGARGHLVRRRGPWVAGPERRPARRAVLDAGRAARRRRRGVPPEPARLPHRRAHDRLHTGPRRPAAVAGPGRPGVRRRLVGAPAEP